MVSNSNSRIQNLTAILLLACLTSVLFNNYSEQILSFPFGKYTSWYFGSQPYTPSKLGIVEYDGMKFYHQQAVVDKEFFKGNKNDKVESKEQSEARLTNESRAKEVKEAFWYGWSSYKEYAWGRDNVAPISKRGTDGWQGWGITLVDSLDLLILMGFDAEYQLALDHVKKIDFTTAKTPVMVFETIIRYLGGLLGAYDLRPDPILLSQAQILADCLLPAFKTPTGLPAHKINFRTGVLQGMGGTNDDKVNLAEVGSLQLEFVRLAQLTGNQTYAKVAQRIIDQMDKLKVKIPGLYPVLLDKSDLSPISDAVSFGAMGDSFYEYLLKRYLLTNKTEDQYKRMYESSINSLHEHLIEQRGEEFDHMMLLTERSVSNQVVYKMDHLACFVPGMLALGGITLDRPKDLLVSQELTHSCRHFYKMTPSGLGPESIGWTPTEEETKLRKMRTGQSPTLRSSSSTISPTSYKDGFHIKDPRYLLRPETLESIFYSYRMTGDPIYQEWAWEIFQAIQQYCKVNAGYAEYADVRDLPGFRAPNLHMDSMESFFLAETLKYLYLIFMPTDLLDLNKYVLTTEAHPLKITHPQK